MLDIIRDKKHGEKLVKGVRELLSTENTILEDFHLVATDVIQALYKKLNKQIKSLKKGQKLRVYSVAANKAYGQKGSYLFCYFNSYSTGKTGTKLAVYDNNATWEVPEECLLEVFDEFHPDSSEGKKRASNVRIKKKGRPRTAHASAVSLEDHNSVPTTHAAHEDSRELHGNDFILADEEEWSVFFPDET